MVIDQFLIRIVRTKYEDNDNLIIALAAAIAYDEGSGNRERYLAQLCKPFATRIVQNAQLENSNTVNL